MAKDEAKDGCAIKAGKGCLGFFLGPSIMVMAIYLLFTNEGSYLDMAQALDELQPQVQRIESTTTPNPELEGKPVHLSGTATTDDVLVDEAYGVQAPAIMLRRNVQYLQWVEKKKQRQGGDKKGTFQSEHEYRKSRDNEWVYSYHLAWVNEPVNSGVFYNTDYRNANYTHYKADNLVQQAQNVQVGNYKLTDAQISRISSDGVRVKAQQVPEALKKHAVLHGEYLFIGRAPEGSSYYPLNPQEPSVGDVRISWKKTSPKRPVSLVAVQTGNSFAPYTASNGATVDLLYTDTKNEAQCFDEARATNTMTLWMVRMGGWLMLWGAFACMLRPLAKMVPLCGKLAEAGAVAISLILGTILALLVITVSWFFCRPVLAVCMLVVVAVLIWWSCKHFKHKKAAL
ncbi:MAG: TMEM43 family protein [Akkermansia sp.]|nr:TMEM43 family protein [Akkermansia sp.]